MYIYERNAARRSITQRKTVKVLIMTNMTKRAYELSLVECRAINGEEAKVFSVYECLALEIEMIYNALASHDDDAHWLARLHDYMIYQVAR